MKLPNSMAFVSTIARPLAPSGTRRTWGGVVASLITGLFTAGAALLSMPAQAQSGSAAPVRVGVIGPFTGPSADFGVPMLNGIQLAVDEINAVGGYLGRPLQLVIKDDKGDPDQGRKASEELLAEKVVAALGFCNTGVAMKSIDLFQQAQTPVIVPCSSGTAVTAKYPAPESYPQARSGPGPMPLEPLAVALSAGSIARVMPSAADTLIARGRAYPRTALAPAGRAGRHGPHRQDRPGRHRRGEEAGP